MVEYLNWLNSMMKSENRKVLLLMDNFSAHESAVKELGGETALSNVEIEWLPPNTTSHWQPLDQGIIASFKLQYRKMWIAYMIRQFDKEMDPLKTVTLLEVINWTAEAWNHYVRPLTIERCWWKSTVVIKPPSPVEDLEWFDVDGLGHADRSLLDEYRIIPMGNPA